MSSSMIQVSKTKMYAEMIRGLEDRVLGAVKEGLTQEQAVFQTQGSNTNIIWTVGHLATAMDHYVYKLMSGKSFTSEEMLKKFDAQVKPTSNPDDYPPISEVIQMHQQVTKAICEFLEASDDDVLSTPFPSSHPMSNAFKSVQDLMDIASFHIGYHCGQITLLRKAQGLEGGYGF